MDIEKMKQDLLKEADTLFEDINNYCTSRNCEKCDFHLGIEPCLKNRLFIALCDGYALGADKHSVNLDIDKMIKELFPRFYINVSERDLEP